MTSSDPPLEGVLPVDKPVGPTSHDIVARVRRALGTRRIGHTGTLDPFASGLMLLCVGRATRIAEYLSGMDKSYRATVRLGARTDTEDATGTVTDTSETAGITCDDVAAALAPLRGDIMQRPPAYSAKKVEGRRAYALARAGRPVDLDPVPVTVHGLAVVRCVIPDIELDISCSSGTYIRAIARDLGDALGVGAHLTALRRSAIGPHDVSQAVPLQVVQNDPATVRAAMVSLLDALGSMPRVEITGEDAVNVRHGRALPGRTGAAGDIALAAQGELVAIARSRDGRLQPRKVFL